jgi:hypothetical protein
LRALLGFLSVSCLFAAIARVPLSTALCLSYTLPFFAYAMALLSGRERLDTRGLFVIGALVGVACITNPSAHADLLGKYFRLPIFRGFYATAVSRNLVRRHSKLKSTRTLRNPSCFQRACMHAARSSVDAAWGRWEAIMLPAPDNDSVTDNGTLDISGTTAGATIQNLSSTGSVKFGSQTLTLSNATGAFSSSGRLVKQGSSLSVS